MKNNELLHLDKEMKLAQEMKDKYCDTSGRETEPQKAAEIMHQIALIYWQRSDKISLIQSVGLLNAAMIRNPENLSAIKSIRDEVCQDILLQAKANIEVDDLIKRASSVKISFQKLRKKVKKNMKSLPQIPTNCTDTQRNDMTSDKISKIQSINRIIADKYTSIMKQLCSFCEKAIGTPPCKYAVAGMGSLARQETTPYSDFEHIILLCDNKNYKTHLEYFRWFSVIFHIIILNVQETIIPSLNIVSFNDKNSLLGNWFYDAITPRGISFDGMMPHACKFPLGRQTKTRKKTFTMELIKPVSEMLKLLTIKEDFKNGYHLADILTKTCIVFGDDDIFDSFAEGSKNHRNQMSHEDAMDSIKNQVKSDLNSFSTRLLLRNLRDKVNLKSLIYRGITLFIAALANLHEIAINTSSNATKKTIKDKNISQNIAKKPLKNTSFDTIDKMAEQGKISQIKARKLQFAVATACEMRLKVYAKHNAQRDDDIDLKQNENIQAFLSIVGEASTINYFQIAYCLQREVAKQLELTKLHFYSDPQLINFTIGLAFGIEKLMHHDATALGENWDSVHFNFEQCLQQLEARVKLNTVIDDHMHGIEIPKLYQLIAQTKEVATASHKLNQYDEAVEFFEQLLIIYENNAKIANSELDKAFIHHEIGVCLTKSHECDKGQKHLERALVIKMMLTSSADEDRDIALTLNIVGICNKKTGQYNVALQHFYCALKIYEKTALIAERDQSIAMVLNNIGICYKDKLQYAKALDYLYRALEIKTAAFHVDSDRNIASTFLNIGICYLAVYQGDDSFRQLIRALKIFSKTTLNAERDRDIATTLTYVGDYFADRYSYHHALKYLNRALKIYKITTLNIDKDQHIAHVLGKLGDCYLKFYEYYNALKPLNNALEIFQNITRNAEEDREIAMTLDSIGRSYIASHQHNDALEHFNNALKIYQKTKLVPSYMDPNIAITQMNIGCCHFYLHQYDDALKHLKHGLEIFQKTALDADKDRNIAQALNNIGNCLLDLHQHEKALEKFKQSLTIKQNASSNADRDRCIASTLNNIGLCHLGLHQYGDALTHIEQALEIYRKTTSKDTNDCGFALTNRNLGKCLTSLKQYDKAQVALDLALNIFQKATKNKHKNPDIVLTYTYKAECLFAKQQYSEALTYFERARKIFNNMANAKNNSHLAQALHGYGLCLMELDKYAEAAKMLKQCLAFYKTLQTNIHVATKIEKIRLKINECNHKLL